MRIKLGITQTILAKQLGTTQQLISKIERNAIDPDKELLYRIADVLHISSSELLADLPK